MIDNTNLYSARSTGSRDEAQEPKATAPCSPSSPCTRIMSPQAHCLFAEKAHITTGAHIIIWMQLAAQLLSVFTSPSPLQPSGSTGSTSHSSKSVGAASARSSAEHHHQTRAEAGALPPTSLCLDPSACPTPTTPPHTHSLDGRGRAAARSSCVPPPRGALSSCAPPLCSARRTRCTGSWGPWGRCATRGWRPRGTRCIPGPGGGGTGCARARGGRLRQGWGGGQGQGQGQGQG